MRWVGWSEGDCPPLEIGFELYDSLGRSESQIQYIGVSEQSSRRVWRMDYKYDSLERTVHRKVFACGYGVSCAESSTHQFVYDDQGRVTKIVDGSGKSIASYTFGTLGQRDQATAGGAVQTRAKSNIKGWQTERQATTVTGRPIPFPEDIIKTFEIRCMQRGGCF
jgi:YD repeat-containing protein